MTIKKPILIIIALILIVPAVIINSPVCYMPLVFLLLLSSFSVIYTILISKVCRLVIEPLAQKSFERETSVSYAVTVINRSFLVLPHISLSLCIESTQGLPATVSEHIFMLRPKEKMALELPVDFHHIGRYNVRLRRLRFFGFLGVFSLSVKPRREEKVHILPKRYNMGGYKINTTSAVVAVDFSVPYKIEGGEYADVRQYFPGDPIKNIHWKLSAHSACFVTRVLQTDAVSGVTIYMDFRLPQNTATENMADINDCTVETAYSIALEALKQNYGVELVYARANAPIVVFPKDYDELQNAVFTLPPVSEKERHPVEPLIAKHSNHRFSLDNIVVITSCPVSDSLIDVLGSCRQKGKYPLICHIRTDRKGVLPESPSGRVLDGLGIEYHLIDSARKLSNILGGLE